MAVVLDGFAPTFERVPFIKPPDPVRMLTAIPRALISLVVNAGVVSAKPLNDQQAVQVSTTLPTTFAYRMIDSQVMIAQDRAASFEAFGELQVTNALRGQPLGVTTRHLLRGGTGFSFATIVAQRFWLIDRNPTMVLQSLRTNVAPVLDWRMLNNDATAAAAGTLHFLATLYEYDIEQVQMFPPLVPVLTQNAQ